MTIMTHCPGCNAPLQIEDNTIAVTCQFCGTHFEVDTSQTDPAFHKSSGPVEPPSQDNVPIVGEILPPASDVYNPPASGETQAPNPNDLYNPPILNAGSSSFPAIDPPPPPSSTPPMIKQPILSGARLWIIIGVVIVAAFCMTCLCLSLFAYQVAR